MSKKLQPYHKMGFVVGNQFAIRVCKYNGNNSQYSRHCAEFAVLNLSRGAIRLWLWFMSRRDQEEFPLSRKQVCEDLAISERTYKNLLTELQEKDYIVPAQLHENFTGYLFIEEGPLRKTRGVSYKGEYSTQFQVV